MNLVTETVTKQVAARGQWKKFGDAVADGPGPNISSTIIGEPVFLKLSMTKENTEQPVKAAVIEAKNIACRHCSGAHWSATCPYKSTFAEDAKTSQAAEEPSKPLKYVPPSQRRAAGQPAAEGTTTTTINRDNQYTIRISNLSEVTTEYDIRELVTPIAMPVRVYVPKDINTFRCRGAAYVSFSTQSEVDKAIRILHRYAYGNVILHVEVAKPQS